MSLSVLLWAWVNAKLSAGAVGSENGSEIDGTVSLGLEKLVKVIGWSMDIWKTVINTTGSSIFAADEGSNTRTTWACDDGVVFSAVSLNIQFENRLVITYCP